MTNEPLQRLARDYAARWRGGERFASRRLTDMREEAAAMLTEKPRRHLHVYLLNVADGTEYPSRV